MILISFYVPAMAVNVRTASGKKSVIKKDALGNNARDYRIIAKERPRSTRGGKTYTPQNTKKFESHIRDHFFKEFPPDYGIIKEVGGKNQTLPIHSIFLGCSEYGTGTPCTKYRKEVNACKVCKDRRKNLDISVVARLKNDRHIDADNILKIVLDALEGVCFYNDTQFYHKEIVVVPYAQEEGLVVSMQERPVDVLDGSVVCAYPVENMRVDTAKSYVKAILQGLEKEQRNTALDYFCRRDSRKYLQELRVLWD